MADRIMTASEVADYVRTPESNLRYWRHRHRGEGPRSFKIGRRVVYYESDVDAWLDAQYADSGGVVT